MTGQSAAREVLRLFAVTRPLFTALGDERRQEIIVFLLDAGAPRSVGDIAAHLGLSQPAVSHHLKILRDARLLTVRRSGTQRLYELNAADYPGLLTPLRDLTSTIIDCATAPVAPPLTPS
ncbi:metalloregulator ArsR/SmtB family transcription factor [Nonomuraea sp. NPDC049695]|uniref:ArsR/SmtB family transcription factor n=1 Tax=Nonomuraea sp. NPDC049695 TaxID=3154734 RepID=UPI003442FBCA